MIFAALVGGAAAAVAQNIAGRLSSAVVHPSAAAFAHGKGKDGPKLVRGWGNGWKKETHARHLWEAVALGYLMAPRWEAVQVDPRLVVWVMHDAVALGDSPPARLPYNASTYQRLADKLGWQLGFKLLFPTPKIVDAVHLAAKASGRLVEPVNIYGADREVYAGQDVDQWLRQQERIARAVKAAGGYPLVGVLSTVGKDCTLSPELADRVGDHDATGEAKGPKLEIYGWPHHDPQKKLGALHEPHTVALAAAGYRNQQSRSTVHGDLDNGENGAGGFWDYAQTERFCAGPCLFDGALANLADVYELHPEVVYDFRGAKVRKVPTRYPRVSPPPVRH